MSKQTTKKKSQENAKIIRKFERVFKGVLSERTMKEYLLCLRQLLSGKWKITSKSKYVQFKAVLARLKEINIDLGIILPRYSKRGDTWKENVVEKYVDTGTLEKIVEGLPDTDKGRQAKIACRIAYLTGLRLSEVLKLTRENISKKQGTIELTVKGKGGKTRTTLLKVQGNEDFAKWLLTEFVGFSISVGYIELALTKVRAKLGSKFSFHSFRHSFITNSLRDGLPMPFVMSMSGHSSLTMLSRYSHRQATDEQLKHAGFAL
jgi:integrase